MSNNHTGNIQNQILQEEHDGDLNAKRTTLVSAPTIFAVINDSSSGLATVSLRGNVTLTDSKGFIGLTTTVLASAPTIYAVVNTSAGGQATVALNGNVTLSDSKGFIGLATVVLGSIPTVTLGTEISGEDPINDLIKVEQQYATINLTSATTVAVKSASGFLQGIWVGAISCPSTILYDSAVPSGTVLTRIPCGMPVGFHPFYGRFNNGLSADAIAGGGGVAPFFTFIYR